MRRTVGTDLQFHGTLKDAQAALRHKSAKTTANVYMQAVPERAALNARTEAVFRAASRKAHSGERVAPDKSSPEFPGQEAQGPNDNNKQIVNSLAPRS